MKKYNYNTLVIGSGAAAYNAALKLNQNGVTDFVIITENRYAGTSRNTGSDKQTYYKLTLSGDTADSVYEMAQTLYEGGAMDGDNALVEAALSPSCFLDLCNIGVAFPQNRYGEYIGYKTDHDPKNRATSVGPYTSKFMTESLEKIIMEKNILMHDFTQVIRVLTKDNEVTGLLALDENFEMVEYNCKNIIFATGGPAGIYKLSVFPQSHFGSSGLAYLAGVKGQNVTLWQYGLASVNPRWNVSGSYMQVLPRFVSIDDLGNEYEFLNDYFDTKADMLDKVFLKGYQWPFDIRKLENGSSIVDILVYKELLKNRKVYLDFTKNPNNNEDIDFKTLGKDTLDYLQAAGVTHGNPYERLYIMNKPAIDFYLDNGVDIKNEYLEISLCAQHNNGGLKVDSWWQTNVKGFFACGEVAGTHGIYRPGGSALNAGQVGSKRAAMFISSLTNKELIPNDIEAINEVSNLLEISQTSNIIEKFDYFTNKMSLYASTIRNIHDINLFKEEVLNAIKNYKTEITINNINQSKLFYRLYDILVTQYIYLYSMQDFLTNGDISRGGCLYAESDIDYDNLEVLYKGKESNNLIQEVSYQNYDCSFLYREPRIIPNEDNFFENVWRQYRENKNIY